MKLFNKISWLFMAVALLALPACGGGSGAGPTVDTGPVFTQVASTALALQTQVAQQVMPAATSIPLASPTPQPIPTLEATSTPPITDTLQPTSTPTSVPVVVYTVPNNGSPAPSGPVPTMNVTLIANDVSTYAVTAPENKVLIFRARVENGSWIPLKVVANLAIPKGWGESESPFSDCPTSSPLLGHKAICTISWKFNPTVAGQVYLRVYVRGYYTDSAGNSQRVTQSPAFIVNVVP